MSRTFFLVSLSVLILVAIGTRLFDLGSDSPAVFAGGSQDFTTDGAYSTLHARNAVLFDNWDLYGDQYWKPLKVTAVSGLSYIIFSIVGPSRVSTNLTGALLNLLSLLIFMAALRKSMTIRQSLFTFFFLAMSFLLCAYARVPFLENGMMFFSALAFLVYRLWFDSHWGKVGVGLLVALCGLFGKAFGFLILTGPVLAILCQKDEKRGRDSLILIGSFLVTTLGLSLIVYGDQGFLNFVLDRGIGEHGSMHILETPLGYLENVISYAASGYHRFTPVLSLVVYLALVGMLLGGNWETQDKKTVIFMLSWLLIWVVALSLFNYRPIRYMYVLVMPMAVLAGAFLDRLPQVRFGPSREIGWWRTVLLMFLNWYLAYYAIILPLTSTRTAESYYPLVWYALPVGLGLTLAQLIFTWRAIRKIPRSLAALAIAVVLVTTCVLEGSQFSRWYTSRTRNLDEANTDLGEILSPNTVVGGQYGPALTAENGLRGILYLLRSDMTTAARQLERYPVTHLAVVKSDWLQLVATAPELLKIPIVASYWLRDKSILVVRVQEFLRPQDAPLYHLSDFEVSSEWVRKGQRDSANFYLERFIEAHPHNKSALLRYCSVLNGVQDPGAWRPTIDTLARLYPTDFWVDFVAAVFYKWLSTHGGDPMLRIKSQEYLERAVTFNRADEAALRSRFQSVTGPSELFPQTPL